MGAHPMGAPGWPELAFCTMSAPRTRMVSMHVVSTEAEIAAMVFCFLAGEGVEEELAMPADMCGRGDSKAAREGATHSTRMYSHSDPRHARAAR